MLLFLVTTSTSAYLFASEDKNNMQRLYALLPLRRADVVRGRYLTCLLFALPYLALATAVMLVFSFLAGSSLAHTFYSMLICTGLVLTAIGIQFPILFKLGYIKAQFMSIAPAFSLLGIVLLLRHTLNIDLLADLSRFGPIHSLIVLAVGVVVLLLSVLLSTRIVEGTQR